MSEQSLSHKFAQHPAYSLQDSQAEARQDSRKQELRQELRVDPLNDLLSENAKQESSSSFSWQDITKALGGSDGFLKHTSKDTQVLTAYKTSTREFDVSQSAYSLEQKQSNATQLDLTPLDLDQYDTADFDLSLAAEQEPSCDTASRYEQVRHLEAAQPFEATLPSNNMHRYGDSLLKYWLSTDITTKQYWPKPLYSPQCSFSKVFLADGTQCDVLEAPDNTRHEITTYPDGTRSERVTDPFGRPRYQSNMQGGQWQIHALSYNDLADKPSPFLSSKRTITSEGNITNIIYGKQGAITSADSDSEDFIA